MLLWCENRARDRPSGHEYPTGFARGHCSRVHPRTLRLSCGHLHNACLISELVQEMWPSKRSLRGDLHFRTTGPNGATLTISGRTVSTGCHDSHPGGETTAGALGLAPVCCLVRVELDLLRLRRERSGQLRYGTTRVIRHKCPGQISLIGGSMCHFDAAELG